MSILNKFLIAAIAFLVIQGILIELIPQYSCIMRDTDHSGIFATLLAVIMMLLNGTFMGTRYFSFAKVGLGALALGVCFKILHLTGADQILVLAPLVIFLSYGIHVIMKRTKTLVDFLKFATTLGFLIPFPLQFFNIASAWNDALFEIGVAVLLWGTFLVFLIVERKSFGRREYQRPEYT